MEVILLFLNWSDAAALLSSTVKLSVSGFQILNPGGRKTNDSETKTGKRESRERQKQKSILASCVTLRENHVSVTLLVF